VRRLAGACRILSDDRSLAEGRAVTRRWWLPLLITVALTGVGCVAGPQRLPAPPVVTAQPVQGVVFVADGSGGLHRVADSLAVVLRESRAPLHVERVDWSHGQGTVMRDLYDDDNQRAHAKVLAGQVLAYRAAHPEQRICLVGYSSGAGVVLAAAEGLPPDTVDRMVLLSPAVASRRDLRVPLRACREGIDNFYSDRDGICLLLTAVGTADGFANQIAGRTGFVPVGDTSQDRTPYQRLRQHAWAGAPAWGGHNGGHYDSGRPEFLALQVTPLLAGR
jgi:pimeloyl-ACP methyl ester carboxylesterase